MHTLNSQNLGSVSWLTGRAVPAGGVRSGSASSRRRPKRGGHPGQLGSALRCPGSKPSASGKAAFMRRKYGSYKQGIRQLVYLQNT